MKHRSIIFIRFNPDDYNKNGTKIILCWTINNKGLCIVKKKKKDEWTQRLNTLDEYINYWIDPKNKTNKRI